MARNASVFRTQSSCFETALLIVTRNLGGYRLPWRVLMNTANFVCSSWIYGIVMLNSMLDWFSVEDFVVWATRQFRTFETNQTFFDVAKKGKLQSIRFCFTLPIKYILQYCSEFWIQCWIEFKDSRSSTYSISLRFNKFRSSEISIRTCVIGWRCYEPFFLSTKAATYGNT